MMTYNNRFYFNTFLLPLCVLALLACDDEGNTPQVVPVDMVISQTTDLFVVTDQKITMDQSVLPMNDQSVVNMNDQSVVNMNDQSVVNMNDQSVVNMNDQSVVNMNDQSVVNMNDQSVVNMNDQSVVNMNDQNLNHQMDMMQVGTCMEDRFSPNQQSSQAVLLAEGLENAHLCAGTEDWYQVSLCAQGSAFFEINADPNLLDLDLELYDAQMRLIDQDLGSQNQSLVLFETIDAQSLYLKVKGKTDMAEGAYQIDFYTSNCRSCQSQNDCHANLGCENQRCIFGACVNDQYESNASSASATRIQIDPPNGTYTLDQLRLCGQDEDWYVFQVCANADVIVAGNFSGILGNLDMMLYTRDQQNQFVLQDQSVHASGNDELVVYQSSIAQDIYLKVFGVGGDLDLGYQLVVDVSNCQ
jgi:hypothetical protein